MTLVIPRADIAEIRASKFRIKADHMRAMGDRKCDAKSYAKIEKGEKVRPLTYQYYLAPLDMTLEEGVEGSVNQENAHIAYVIHEPEILRNIKSISAAIAPVKKWLDVSERLLALWELKRCPLCCALQGHMRSMAGL